MPAKVVVTNNTKTYFPYQIFAIHNHADLKTEHDTSYRSRHDKRLYNTRLASYLVSYCTYVQLATLQTFENYP